VRTEVIVKPNESANWKNCGDEPCMLHRELPDSWLAIGPNRIENVQKIEPRLKENAVFILDDGFQHRKLHRDIDIVCLTADTFSDSLIPAGYLREPVKSLKRADFICIIGSEEEEAVMVKSQKKLMKLFGTKPSSVIYQRPSGWVNVRTGESSEKPRLSKPALVAGIARPERFVKMVKKMGLEPERIYQFGDHHRFCEKDIEKITATEDTDGIITTQKDACRLSGEKLVRNIAIWYLNIDFEFRLPQERKKLQSILSSRLAALS
jgi:tetraacyldisaccharide 4'-kinase